MIFSKNLFLILNRSPGPLGPFWGPWAPPGGEKNWNEIEKFVKKLKNVSIIVKNTKTNYSDDPNIEYLEKELTVLLGLKVTIKNNMKNKGYLSIHYTSLDQLDPIIDKLKWRPK